MYTYPSNTFLVKLTKDLLRVLVVVRVQIFRTNTNTGTRSGVYVINDEPNFRVLLEISAKRRQWYEIIVVEYYIYYVNYNCAKAL